MYPLRITLTLVFCLGSWGPEPDQKPDFMLTWYFMTFPNLLELNTVLNDEMFQKPVQEDVTLQLFGVSETLTGKSD